MNKLRNVLFSVLMFFSLFCTMLAVSAEEDTEDVIYIGNTEEFLTFLKQCNYDAWSYGKVFELRADINLSEEAFSTAPVFAGTLNGNGHIPWSLERAPVSQEKQPDLGSGFAKPAQD